MVGRRIHLSPGCISICIRPREQRIRKQKPGSGSDLIQSPNFRPDPQLHKAGQRTRSYQHNIRIRLSKHGQETNGRSRFALIKLKTYNFRLDQEFWWKMDLDPTLQKTQNSRTRLCRKTGSRFSLKESQSTNFRPDSELHEVGQRTLS